MKSMRHAVRVAIFNAHSINVGVRVNSELVDVNWDVDERFRELKSSVSDELNRDIKSSRL